MRRRPPPSRQKCPKVFEGGTLGVDFLDVLEVNVRNGRVIFRCDPVFSWGLMSSLGGRRRGSS